MSVSDLTLPGINALDRCSVSRLSAAEDGSYNAKAQNSL